jgi:hypothetical protein
MGTTQNSRRSIFKFLTPLTASVEKTAISWVQER